MKNKLKNWPKNWIEHVTETCFLYFEDKGITFIESKILCSSKTKNAKIYGIRLTFKKYENIYDIFINYEGPIFILNYYYKNYYRFNKNMGQQFIFMIDTILKGSDSIGLFNYFDLGGESSRDNITTAYDISKSIENTINCHSDKDCDDEDNDREDGDPIEPFSPRDAKELELLHY